MDIIISLATKDFQIVKKVVRYCRLYLQTEEESIFLITKIENKIFPAFMDKTESCYTYR